jgi:hypothetical protein
MIRIGPAGWSYKDWDGIVYPPKPPKGFHGATYLAEIFDTIEVNSSFYRPLLAVRPFGQPLGPEQEHGLNDAGLGQRRAHGFADQCGNSTVGAAEAISGSGRGPRGPSRNSHGHCAEPAPGSRPAFVLVQP